MFRIFSSAGRTCAINMYLAFSIWILHASCGHHMNQLLALFSTPTNGSQNIPWVHEYITTNPHKIRKASFGRNTCILVILRDTFWKCLTRIPLLLTTYYLPFTTYYLLLTIHDLLLTPYHLLLTTYYTPLTTHHSLHTTHYSLVTLICLTLVWVRNSRSSINECTLLRNNSIPNSIHELNSELNEWTYISWGNASVSLGLRGVWRSDRSLALKIYLVST